MLRQTSKTFIPCIVIKHSFKYWSMNKETEKHELATNRSHKISPPLCLKMNHPKLKMYYYLS